MKLSNNTKVIFKNFSSINNNLVIKAGKSISTISPGKDILANYNGDDDFDKTISIFNMSEFLGVLSAFNDPELVLDDDFLTVKEDRQTVKYIYADESLLITPSKAINMPTPEITFKLSDEQLAKIQKMAGILSVDDLAFVGDGDKIVARVYDSKNPTGNSYDVDLDSQTTETFNVILKVDKLKIVPGAYDVQISSKKISKFSHDSIDLHYFIAVEATSTFN